MRVLIAPTAFPGALNSPQAATAIAEGWRRHAPDDDLRLCPLSDGGPGFVDAVHAVRGGQLSAMAVAGPLSGRVPASLLLLDEDGGRSAYVEAAQACGLHLVPGPRRDPMTATSRGVGELLEGALRAGATRLVVGLGALASHDAGAGLLGALGAGDRDALGRGGAALRDVPADVVADLAAVRDRLAGVELVAAADTDVPLLGFHGASAADAQDRGATAAQAQELESALGHFAHVVQATPGVPPPSGPALAAAGRVGAQEHSQGHSHEHRAPRTWAAHPGAGAGGGLGFALAVLGGDLRPGPKVGLDAAGFAARVAGADLVVTGQGVFGWESVRVSVVSEVASRSLEVGVPVVVVAGEVEVGRREMVSMGVEAAYAVTERSAGSRPPAADPAEALAARAARVARTWSRA